MASSSASAAAGGAAVLGLSREAAIYAASDPQLWFAERGLWAGVRVYDDTTKDWLARSGHYIGKPPPGALLVVGIEDLVAGLFGRVPSGMGLRGLAVLGRPVARRLPQDGTWAELTRFVLDRALEKTHAASHLLRVAAELWFDRPSAEVIVTYHDRTRHSGCIYKKSGFRKFGGAKPCKTRTWGTRAGREQAMTTEETPKRRWRLDAATVRDGVRARQVNLIQGSHDGR